MITDEGMDYWDPSRTTIMKGKGDLKRVGLFGSPEGLLEKLFGHFGSPAEKPVE